MNRDDLNLEEELRRTLKREDPSPGFTERVLQRVEERPRTGRNRAWMAMAAALAVAAIVPAAVHQYREEQQETARRAGRELAIALNIASHKLQNAQKMVHRRMDGI